jgi:hypothetical protein
MRIPTVAGLIRRRLLVNYRVDPDVIQRRLPARFRPKLHDGYAIAGICLIRLEEVRPRFAPRILGINSENAAHRIAVTWENKAGPQEGVYIPRRDSGSLINQLAGGRIFPGEHHSAKFHIEEHGSHIDLRMESLDGLVKVEVAGTSVFEIPHGSCFHSLADASKFFEAGSLGYSETAGGRKLDGLVLGTDDWKVEPLAVDRAYSSYFADTALFRAARPLIAR